MRKITISFILLSVFSLLSIQANADIHYVATTGNDSNSGLNWASAKHSINAAIISAVSGDKVWVKAGTYNETSTVLLKEGVSIYGGFVGTESLLTDRLSFPRAQPDSNATIVDGTSLNDSVVRAPSGITNSTFIDGFTIQNGIGRLGSDTYRYGGGIDSANGAPIIQNCRIINNTAGYGGGILSYTTTIIVRDNYISYNQASRVGSGILIYAGTIQNNIIEYNQHPSSYYGGGIFAGTGSANTLISGNTIRNNSSNDIGGGIFASGSSNLTISSNSITDNRSKYAAGVYCSNSNATIDGNDISRNEIPSNYSDTHGVGVYSASSNTTLTNNQITNNILNATGSSYGGGYYADYGSSSLVGNTISNNTGGYNGGGVHIVHQTTFNVSYNTIFNNTALYNGAGIYENVNNSGGSINNNKVFSNTAGYAGGGIYSLTSSAAVNNNIITSNSAIHGSGIFLGASTQNVINNTICSNISTLGGSVQTGSSSNVGLKNNIVAFNTAGFLLDATSSATLSKNDIFSNTNYNYNPTSLSHPTDISSDPLFVNRSGADYHLQNIAPNISPCVNAGDNASVATGVKDIDGQDRINSLTPATVDIGADEVYQLPTPTFSLAAGNYSSAKNIALSCSVSGVNIYYTTDGSTPTKQSSLYTAPIAVNTTTTIKAIACKSDYADSDIAVADYIIDFINPTLGIASCAQNSPTSPIVVSFSGASDLGGSGLNHVELWYKKDIGGSWTNTGLLVTASSSGTFDFIPSLGAGTYYFDLVAEDNAGNKSIPNPPVDLGQCSSVYSYGIVSCSFVKLLLPWN